MEDSGRDVIHSDQSTKTEFNVNKIYCGNARRSVSSSERSLRLFSMPQLAVLSI